MPPQREKIQWCTPTSTIYGQLPGTKQHAGGQHKRYKDQLHVNFKSCNLDHTKWETLAEDRSAWRDECHNAVNGFEEQLINVAKVRRAARKDRGHTVSSTSTVHTCDVWTNLFVPYRPLQSQTKISLRFVVSTTNSMYVYEKMSFCINTSFIFS